MRPLATVLFALLQHPQIPTSLLPPPQLPNIMSFRNLLAFREGEDFDETPATDVDKSPESSLIGGLVAGLASAAMLALIFYVLWRTRKRSYLTPQPERIVPIREVSQTSTHAEYPVININIEPGDEEKDGPSRTSRASSMSRSRTQGASPGLMSPV